MGLLGTRMRLLVLVSCFVFVPISFSADITKGEFTGHIDNKPGIKEKLASTPTQKRKTYPFHGYVQSIDDNKKVLILEGKKPRLIRIDSQTRITRFDSSIPFIESKPGERVTGSVVRDENGNELAVSVKLAGVPAVPVKASPKKSKTAK